MTPQGDEPQVRPADTDALIERVPEGLTLDECFAWMRRYSSEPFSSLALTTSAARDHSPLKVMASLGWHAKQLADALAREREAREKVERKYEQAVLGLRITAAAGEAEQETWAELEQRAVRAEAQVEALKQAREHAHLRAQYAIEALKRSRSGRIDRDELTATIDALEAEQTREALASLPPPQDVRS